MCRWLTYCGDPIYLDTVIFEQRNSLIQQSLHARHSHVTTNGDGFGVGWYAERDTPGVYRDILPAWNDANLRSITHQIRSGLFLAHVRASTGTATSRANCHPFQHGKWLFMHNGQIGGYQRVRRALEAELDDRYYAHRLGTTDSELIFYLMFSEGLEQDATGAIERALTRVVRAMRDEAIEEPLRFTAALTDGHRILAVRFASDGQPPSLFWREHGQDRLVVSEPLDEEQSGWHEVPASHVLVTERRGGILLEKLDVAA
ncbi:MAG: class II glutamine amidotransferase [Gammaproteobacteria bacterium]